MFQRTLITSALPYASGITHLGNVVGSTLPGDLYARFCRLHGRETLYVCGSDEHGVSITIAADKEGVTPKELVDRYHGINKAELAKINIAFDVFGRTTDQVHFETAQEFFASWLADGLLTERAEDQFYDEEAGIFLPDRYVEGVCPNCGFDKARGDQCDNCGAYYNQLDLTNPKSVVSGKTPVVRKTKHWYFRLDAFQDWIHSYVEDHANDWKDNVVQQSRSWVKQGLVERAATRDMRWGIPVPAPDADGKVLYVWFEAVLGYISATKQWAAEHASDDAWKTWWCDDATRYVAFLGKDNIVFHTIIFPILLHSRQREGYILPDAVPANEFLNLEGKRFSKSRNWYIDLASYNSDFSEPHHADVLRYVLTMNMPETRDSDFAWKDYQARNNNELAAILGNYVNRVMHFTAKNFNNVVPDASAAAATSDEDLLATAVETGVKKVADSFDAFRFRDAATDAMNIARAANKYFNDRAPWKSIKENPDDAARTLNICIQTIRTLSIVFAPFIPNASAKMQQMLGEPIVTGAPNEVSNGSSLWDDAINHTIPGGRALGDAVILFEKIEDDVIDAQIAKLGPPEEAPSQENSSQKSSNEKNDDGLIDINQFMDIKLRSAVVVEAEPVPKSKKLLRLIVDLGSEKRQVLAGIAQHYTPEDLIGTVVVVVANLKPAKLMGMESQGMILAASDSTGKLTLVSPRDAGIGAGAEVR